MQNNYNLFNRFTISKTNIINTAIALIWWLVTFFTDHLAFEALSGGGVFSDLVSLKNDSLAHYIICKAVLFILIWYLIHFLILAIRGIALKDREKSCTVAAGTIKYAAIYFIPVIAVLAFKLPQGFLSNDETLIFGEASRLATYTWFYYLTTYYYIVTMMLIPCWLGPVLTKVALQVLVCGYCVYRYSEFLKNQQYIRNNQGAASGNSMIKKAAIWCLYLPFLLPPVLAYTTSAHRIPVYFLLYIYMLFVMFMDMTVKVVPTKKKLFWIFVCGAAITQWRTEGIYMLPLLLILTALAYPSLTKSKKSVFGFIVASLLIQYLFTVPQNGFVANRLSDQADNRMGPFWAYTVTNMYRNGLDLEANKEDMEKIWRYLDKDTLEAINADLGDINYEDVLILYYEGYTGKIMDATPEDYNAYVEGCKSLFIHNPGVFIKTRIGAFSYAAMPYHIALTEGGIKGILKLIVSIVKTIAYNLYLPCVILLVFWLVSFIKRKWFAFFAFSGLCCHWFIVFILAPASYFKYYFPIYMTAYFVVIYYIITRLTGIKEIVKNDSDKQA